MSSLIFRILLLSFCFLFCAPAISLETRCVRIKLKKEAIAETKKWYERISTVHKEKLDEFMGLQGRVIQSVFLDQIGEDYYLIYFEKAEDFEESTKIAQQSTDPIKIQHRDYKKRCWETERIVMKPILDLERSSP